MSDINIICMRWGKKYGADYVRVLRSAVKRHLNMPHRFVCLTDAPRDLPADIETLPIPPLPAGERERGWKKIALFKPELHDLKGTALFLDLDIVILRDLAPFLEASGDLLIIPEWRTLGMRLGLVQYSGGNSSVFRFRIGEQAQIYEAFTDDPSAARASFRNEQRFLSAHARGMGFWDSELCASFKYDCLRPFPAHFFAPPPAPKEARIVVFHGIPSPHELLSDRWWGRKTRRGYGAVPWVRDYWRKNDSQRGDDL